MEQQAAAFQKLLGLTDLPQTGRQAADASRSLDGLVMAGAVVSPLLGRLVADHLSADRPPPPRFIDVSTGLRLRYYEWGNGNEVVMLLHDLGESADIWVAIGRSLADRGYHVFALDLRGHGESSGSRDGLYSAAMLAEDVRAFNLARDLYVAPLAVVGCGMGAAAGLALAQHDPYLVGALVVAEFSLPVAQLKAQQEEEPAEALETTSGSAQEGSSISSGTGALSSKQLLPWWGFRAGQAATFGCVEHCAVFLAHPLASLPPGLLMPLARAAQRALAAAEPQTSEPPAVEGGAEEGIKESGSTVADEVTVDGDEALSERAEVLDPAEDAALLQQLLAQAQRPLRGAVASACSMLRLPPGLVDGYAGGGDYYGDFGGGDGSMGLKPRMDPAFLFSFDHAAMAADLRCLRCHLLLAHGTTGGSWADPDDLAAMALAAAIGGAASTAVAELAGAGHFLAADHPEQLLKQIIGFLEGQAIRCFDRRSLAPTANQQAGTASGGGAGRGSVVAVEAVAEGCRRPELLGLKTLPQYASIEEAKKALGPRSIPTAAIIEEELVKLRVEEGREADDASSDGGEASGHITALAKEPADYFGFVG